MGSLVSSGLLLGVSFRRLLVLKFQLGHVGYWWQEVDHWLEVGHLHVGIVLHPLWHVEYNVSFETLSPPLFAYERSSILKVLVTTERLHFLPSILLTLEVVLVYLAGHDFRQLLGKLHLERRM